MKNFPWLSFLASVRAIYAGFELNKTTKNELFTRVEILPEDQRIPGTLSLMVYLLALSYGMRG